MFLAAGENKDQQNRDREKQDDNNDNDSGMFERLLKRIKDLVKNLSKSGRKLNSNKFEQLKRIVEKVGGKLREPRAGEHGRGQDKHTHIEGLGSKIESRHIYLE